MFHFKSDKCRPIFSIMAFGDKVYLVIIIFFFVESETILNLIEFLKSNSEALQ
jgi:hypothetical protein